MRIFIVIYICIYIYIALAITLEEKITLSISQQVFCPYSEKRGALNIVITLNRTSRLVCDLHYFSSRRASWRYTTTEADVSREQKFCNSRRNDDARVVKFLCGCGTHRLSRNDVTKWEPGGQTRAVAVAWRDSTRVTPGVKWCHPGIWPAINETTEFSNEKFSVGGVRITLKR